MKIQRFWPPEKPHIMELYTIVCCQTLSSSSSSRPFISSSPLGLSSFSNSTETVLSDVDAAAVDSPRLAAVGRGPNTDAPESSVEEGGWKIKRECVNVNSTCTS